MQYMARIALGLGAAALVASGGSAFTASNTDNETERFVGYNTATVTGVTVSNIAYAQKTGDISTLDKIVFDISENLTVAQAGSGGYVAKLTLNGPLNGATTCDITVINKVTCDFTDVAYSFVTSIQLNVSPT